MKKYRFVISILVLVLALSLFVPGLCYAAPGSSGQEEALSITVPFPSFDEKRVYEWDFPYSDAYFLESPEIFSMELAKASMGLAVSAFRNNKGLMENQYATYLEGAGFQDIYAFGYDKETSKDTLSGVIAHKKIGDTTLIAAVPCGQGYWKEWAGNLEVGYGERHEGFDHAAKIMEEEISAYLTDHNLEGNLKLWMTGFSRASAVSNLVAADMIDSGIFEDVYAYLFAVPRTTKADDVMDYEGIYNICGKYDPVTQIPPQAWGYERYGADLYTPALEMDSNYVPLALNADTVNNELQNDLFYYNPEVSYQLHLIIEFLCELFPTSDDYADILQDTLMSVWSEANPETFAMILIEALGQMEELDSRQAYSSDIFIDYLTYISTEHMRENPKQVQEGFWNPRQGITDNIMREHMPYTYIDWVFSDNPENSLYFGPDVTRRDYFYGDMDVEIWKDGHMVRGIDRKGKEIASDGSDDDSLYENVLLLRSGTQTVFTLPFDGEYTVHLRTYDDNEYIQFYNIYCTPYLTFGGMESINLLNVDKGEYLLDYSDLEKEFTLRTIEGETLDYRSAPFEYSPTLFMAGESSSSYHITIPGMLVIIVLGLAGILLLLLVCLIIAIVHKIRKKKRNKPYSPLFVIIPHLLLVAYFQIMAQYFTVYLFSIRVLRIINVGLAMLVIVLLALRGLIRNRCIRNLVITLALAASAAVNVFLYQRSGAVSSALIHLIGYSLCVAGLCALACLTFYRRKAAVKKNASGEGGELTEGPSQG